MWAEAGRAFAEAAVGERQLVEGVDLVTRLGDERDVRAVAIFCWSTFASLVELATNRHRRAWLRSSRPERPAEAVANSAIKDSVGAERDVADDGHRDVLLIVR